MIGFFDSGLGGLTILREVIKRLPEYNYIYLGDNLRTPYGSRSREAIYDFTAEGATELFKRGAEIIILACNTSSAVALRKLQREFLPINFPDKKILGIIIPTAEEIGNYTKNKNIGILATEATAGALTYTKEIGKIYPNIRVVEQGCPLLVPLIEAGKLEGQEIEVAVQNYIKELLATDDKIDTIILGCTHYAIIANIIKKYAPMDVKVLSQSEIIAEKLKNYIARHPEIEIKLKKEGKRQYFTTQEAERINNLANLFYGEKIKIEKINL
jgi:glutamate racemase